MNRESIDACNETVSQAPMKRRWHTPSAVEIDAADTEATPGNGTDSPITTS